MNASAAAASVDSPITFTIFPNVKASEKHEYQDRQWDSLVSLIKDPAQTYESKSGCPLISLSEFGDRRTDKQSLRHAANVVRVWGVEGDYDGETTPLEFAAEKLQKANIKAVLYTSPSSSKEKPRWRVIAPLSESHLPEKRAEYLGRINRVLGGVLAPESFVISQCYYVGRVRGVEYETAETAGRCVDLAIDIEPLFPAGRSNGAAHEPNPRTDSELRDEISRGVNRQHAMLSLSGRLASRGMSADDIAAELHRLMDGCPDAHSPHWSDLRAEIPRLAASAVRKYSDPRGGDRGEVVSQESQRSSQADAFEPEPLRRPLPPAAEYPLDALGPTLSAAARRIHEVVQAPAAICGQSILAAASLAVQAQADVSIDGRREPLSISAITIAESGERKSAVDRLALQPHREFERKALDQYRFDLKLHKLAADAHACAQRAASRRKDLAAIRSALEEIGPSPAPPLNPIFLAPTPTLEGLHKLYAGGPPSIGLFHDDGGEFFGGHAMSDEHRMKSAAGLSRLWDFGEFDRIRAGDGAHKFSGRRLASHLMVQPVVAESILSDEILTRQGLLARTLMAWPTSTIGQREYVETDLGSDPAVGSYFRRVSELLRVKLPLREGSANELDPRPLLLKADAKAAWIEIHDAIEADQRDGGAFSSVRAWASKAPAQILRIAGVLTLIENHDAGVISVEAIENAAKLVHFYLGEAVRIVGTSSVAPAIRHAEALRDWCHRERKELLYSRAALQFGPACIRSADTFDAAIEVLERTGWAKRVEGGCVLDGAPRRRVWAIRGVQV